MKIAKLSDKGIHPKAGHCKQFRSVNVLKPVPYLDYH